MVSSWSWNATAYILRGTLRDVTKTKKGAMVTLMQGHLSLELLQASVRGESRENDQKLEAQIEKMAQKVQKVFGLSVSANDFVKNR